MVWPKSTNLWLIDNQERFPGNCELSGDNGKGEESQEDENGCQEVHLPTGTLEVKSIKVRVADGDFDFIAAETNRYFEQTRPNRAHKPFARMNSWYDTNGLEMQKFFGLTILILDIFKKRKSVKLKYRTQTNW